MTQVSRGPWARRERARAAPLCAVATEEEKSPEQHLRLPSPSPGPAAHPRTPAPRRPSSAQTLHGAVPAGPRARGLGFLAVAGLFFFFLLRLPTCQLMDLITHSGACSSAAARFIHAAPFKPARGPRTRSWWGGAQTLATTRPRGPAPLSPGPRAALGGAANSPLFTCNSLLRGRRPGEC